MLVKEVIQKIEIPEGEFGGGNCSDCLHYVPQNRNDEGKGYCEHYDTYYSPSERNGCFNYVES